MDDMAWVLVIVGVGAILFEMGRRWYRRRLATRLADKLLADVVNEKDAFRR